MLQQVVKGFNLFYCTRCTLESVFIIGKKMCFFKFISSILTSESSLEEFQTLLSILHSYEVGFTVISTVTDVCHAFELFAFFFLLQQC